MTPAINIAKKSKIFFKVHEYIHDSTHESYGIEAANKLGVEEDRVFKTLIVSADNNFVVCIIPVSSMLSMKSIAKAIGAKKASMAAKLDVERATGYILGGVSPLGQKKRIKTVIDSSAEIYPTIYVSAGRRGLEIELSPYDLCQLVDGHYFKLTQ